MTTQQFGGNWTIEKLDILSKYLKAYSTALKNQKFKRIYIDAFAGSVYRTTKNDQEDSTISLFNETDNFDAEKFFEGSSRIALSVDPPFDKYYFIDQDINNCRNLESLRADYSNLSDKINIINEDANFAIERICNQYNWKKDGYRAILFLDPFGMQVRWETLKHIAKTEAIDLWYLFPLGMGVNRLLRKDGKLSDAHLEKLNNILGSSDWQNIFYVKNKVNTLFGDEEIIEKVGDFKTMSNFVIERLKEIFPGVAPNPRLLYNSKNNPLFMFCFAVSNPDYKAYGLALKIANYILKG